MSNYLAIATVTATLRQILQESIAELEINANVTHMAPKSSFFDKDLCGINIFLYQVTPNSSWRNMDLPTRRHDGRLVQRPQVALDLYYLLSFYGDETKLEPQRLLGRAVSALDSEPILTGARIEDAISNDYLADSDLAEQIERVKFIPLSLNLEELSKLWSLFADKSAYALSVTYQASVVLIEEEITPKPTLPVRESRLLLMPFRQPVIESISASFQQDKTPAIITAGSQIVIKGQNLRADDVKITFGGYPDPVSPNQVSKKQIKVTLPNGLRAGVNSVQVVHRLDFGPDSGLHRGFESNVAAFVLRPSMTAQEADSGTVTLTLSPMVGQTQRVMLLLNHVDSPTTAYSFNAPTDRADETDTIEFVISHVQSGEYLVRVQVDGAVSLLETDKRGKYSKPTVRIQNGE